MEKIEEDKIRIALIPSYEPDEKLINIVENLRLNDFLVVVVNDGSSKEYDKYFANLDAEVISYKKNRGKGYALKKGLKYIKANYQNYVVVTMDSDGQHRVEDAIKLCSYASLHPNTLVLGSRKRNKNIPLRSYLGNTITRIVYTLVTKVDIYDTQTGLRVFTDDLVDYMLAVEGERFEYEMNVLLNATRNNIAIKEIVIKTIYIDNNSGSHFNGFKDSLKIYKEIVKFSMSSILSFIIDYSLYTILFFLSGSIIYSNVLARIVSSFFNYNVNEKLVFKNSRKRSLLNYYCLVVTILVLNTFILSILASFINAFVAKILTEFILFILSFYVQKKYIFKGSDNN